MPAQVHNFGLVFQGLSEKKFWNPVIYSPSRNTAIFTICKNASSSMEAWARREDNDLINLDHDNASVLWQLPETPTLVTILRDPMVRAKSAIAMLIEQHMCFGLTLTWENFSVLEIADDRHLMPQSLFVPTVDCSSNITDQDVVLYDTHVPSRFKSWSDVVREYDLVSRITDKNKFFYIKEHNHNVLTDIAAYLDMSDDTSEIFDNPISWHNTTYPTVSKEYEDYLRAVYATDYGLIDSVRFENS